MDPTTGQGEVRVVIKELKKHSAACVACRKRKARCSGTSPCLHCTQKGIDCIFTEQKKRGPQAKKPKTNNTKVIQYANLATSPLANIAPNSTLNLATLESTLHTPVHVSNEIPIYTQAHSANLHSNGATPTSVYNSNSLPSNMLPNSAGRAPCNGTSHFQDASYSNELYSTTSNTAYYNPRTVPSTQLNGSPNYTEQFPNQSYAASVNRKEQNLFEEGMHTIIIDKYFDSFGAGMPFITNYARIVRPVTASETMQQRAVLALMHTAAGDKERSAYYLREARQLSGDLFDTFTLPTASAFMMMAINYLDIDTKLASHYAGIARHIAFSSEDQNVPIMVRVILFVGATILDSSLSPEKKLAVFHESTVVPKSEELVMEALYDQPPSLALKFIFYTASVVECVLGCNVLFATNPSAVMSKVRSPNFCLREEDYHQLSTMLDSALAITSRHVTVLRKMRWGYTYIIHGLKVVIALLSLYSPAQPPASSTSHIFGGSVGSGGGPSSPGVAGDSRFTSAPPEHVRRHIPPPPAEARVMPPWHVRQMRVVDEVSKMRNALGGASASLLKINLFLETGLLNVILALLKSVPSCQDLAYPVKTVIDNCLIPEFTMMCDMTEPHKQKAATTTTTTNTTTPSTTPPPNNPTNNMAQSSTQPQPQLTQLLQTTIRPTPTPTPDSIVSSFFHGTVADSSEEEISSGESGEEELEALRQKLFGEEPFSIASFTLHNPSLHTSQHPNNNGYTTNNAYNYGSTGPYLHILE